MPDALAILAIPQKIRTNLRATMPAKLREVDAGRVPLPEVVPAHLSSQMMGLLSTLMSLRFGPTAVNNLLPMVASVGAITALCHQRRQQLVSYDQIRSALEMFAGRPLFEADYRDLLESEWREGRIPLMAKCFELGDLLEQAQRIACAPRVEDRVDSVLALALDKSKPPVPEDQKDIAHVVQALRQSAGLIDDNEHLAIAALKAELRGTVGHDEKHWPASARQAIWTLIVCAMEAENLAKEKGAKQFLEWDAGKLSLDGLRQALIAYKDDSTENFARHVVLRFVLVQHLNVATERSVAGLDDKQRFVFSPEQDGLTRFAEVGAARFVDAQESGDILFHALLLLKNCGKLQYIPVGEDRPTYLNRFEGTFLLKKAGRKLLDEAI